MDILFSKRFGKKLVYKSFYNHVSNTVLEA